jgi:type III pantothenate kinase
MNLVVDLGNTSIKAGLFESEKLLDIRKNLSIQDIIQYAQENEIACGIICSVSQDPLPLQQALQPFIPAVYILNHQLPIPFTNGYATPHTLGADRVAAVAGAQARYPSLNCLVVDLGTCITYDVIDSSSHYWGGSISPGLYMRFNALHTFTSRLPLIDHVSDLDVVLTGKNTKEAILSGVINGMAAEIEGIIQKYQKKFDEIHVIFCGGDATFFESRIKERIFVVPELVLIGLNSILQYNVSKN